MTDWSKPSLTDAYASVLTELMGRDTDALTWLIGTSSTNLPNGSVRWNATTYRWEIFNSSGGTWSAWSTQINVGTVLLGGNAAAGTLQAIPISQADARYQATGSYAALGGNAAQVFLVANSTAATQGAVPRAQADSLYAPAGSYAALGGLGTQVFLVANSAAGTQQAVPRAQADTLYATLAGLGTQVFLVGNSTAGTQQAVPRAQADTLYAAAGSGLAANYFTPVNNTGAASDLSLGVGQSAYITVSGVTSVPLHIACGDNELYEVFLQFPTPADQTTQLTYLKPNNTTYASAFYYESTAASGTATGGNGGVEKFFVFSDQLQGFSRAAVSTKTTSKYVNCVGGGYQSFQASASYWSDTTTVWSSLGTIVFPVAVTGQIVIRRVQ